MNNVHTLLLRIAARRGAAAGGHLQRCRSSTMCHDIACVAAPCICPPGARAKVQTLFIDRPLGKEAVHQDSGFTKKELSMLKGLSRPEKIQSFLDSEILYNKEPDGQTCRSPRYVIHSRVAHCIEGALFAAAALRLQGHPPLILDIEAVRDDDHIIALFKESGHWGAVAKSNYSGLRFREPVYRTLRELVMSYFEHYFNLKGEKTLRRFSRPVNLCRFDWIHLMTSENNLWEIGEHLIRIPHCSIMTPAMIRRLRPVDRRLYDAGLMGSIE